MPDVSAKPAGKEPNMTSDTPTPEPAPTPEPEQPTPPAPIAYTTLLPHFTPAEHLARGRAARQDTPRSSHASWETWSDRPDPIDVLEEQGAHRTPELLPIRYGRMVASPFAFYRGGAAIMASDLATTPRSGLKAQCCGDAHLVNFGVFASPDRSLVFDINDFDETLPGPWEWDVKRLAASFEVAMRDRGMDATARRGAVLVAARTYRETMLEFAQLNTMDVWYARLDAVELLENLQATGDRKDAKRVAKGLEKAQSKNSLRALEKLTVTVDGEPRIISNPPLIVPASELLQGAEFDRFTEVIHQFLSNYAASLPDDRRHLLTEFEFKQIARKVVGVGSVGMRSWIVLTLGRNTDDPLFLQLKQAESSVMERFVGRSRYRNHGRRVVEGQRLMQAASDILLGWYKVLAFDGLVHDFYVRQLWDGKASLDVATMPARMFGPYARACGWTLARAHARSGDRIAIAGYLGAGSVFDEAIADFAATYADQNERDYEKLVTAVKSGRIAAQTGV
ncbi:MAG: DUF2252 domain-containing protein [Coriobacteriia bacterium]|nr:DUF2252 domain-containing protein [Coriobacteriia bacterium]